MREVLGDSMLIISWFKRSFLNYLHVVVQGMKEIRPGFDIIDLRDENGRFIQNPKCSKQIITLSMIRAYSTYYWVATQTSLDKPGFSFVNYEVSPKTYSFANLQTISFSAASTSTST